MQIKKKIDKILELMLIITMSVLVIDVLWQVISRYVNKFTVSYYSWQMPAKYYAFTDELAGFLLIWVALLGASYVTGKKQHLAIDLISNKLTEKNRVFLFKFINILILIFAFGVLVVGGSWLVYSRFYLGQVSASLEIPIGFVYLVLPLSGVLTCYYVLFDFFTLSKNDKK